VLWNDPELGIDWGVAADEAILSAKDALGLALKDAEVFA
jgi:dTDP-4-dehydrorhamnose 3,5-epimerase-like enzyme